MMKMMVLLYSTTVRLLIMTLGQQVTFLSGKGQKSRLFVPVSGRKPVDQHLPDEGLSPRIQALGNDG